MGAVLRRAAILLGLAAVVGMVDAAIRPIRLSFDDRPPAPARGPSAPIAPESQGRFITLDEAKTWHADPTAVFVDASEPAEYRQGRIPGAFNLPPEVFGGGAIPDLLSQISRESMVIVYCRTSACDAAVLVALRMQEFGFTRTLVFKEGFAAWKAAGLPIQN